MCRLRLIQNGVFMQETLTLVIATGNPGKTAEIRDLLKGFPVNIKNLDEFGPLPPVVEDGALIFEDETGAEVRLPVPARGGAR